MNRSDRRIAVAATLVAVMALVALFATDGEDKTPVSTAVRQDSVVSQRPHRQGYYRVASQQTVETFPFDPNTADSSQLLRLGLQPWQVRNIYKYRAHGGIYRHKEDFARLYGLTVKDYRRLEPFIRISPDYQPAASLVGDRPRSYYAKEIVRLRQWLGGFVSTDQLDEIEGFPAAAKRYFTVSSSDIRRLNINQLSLQELRRHPYINYYQAKAIVDYRRLHGPIRSLNDLRFSRDFTPETIARLAPYVTF